MDWANSFVFRFQVRERFFIQTCLNNLKNSSSLLRLRNFSEYLLSECGYVVSECLSRDILFSIIRNYLFGISISYLTFKICKSVAFSISFPPNEHKSGR
jgi:hypothetical protein